MIDRIYRTAVLSVAGNKTVEELVRTRGWSIAQRFVAGDELADAVRAVEELEREGVYGILDLLGEMVTSEEEANTFAEKILAILDALEGKPYPKYVSIKLSQIGQDLPSPQGENLGMVNARRILARARQIGAFVRLDMEDHPRTDQTLAEFRTLVGEFGAQTVGTVLQSYLYRTEGDLASLADLAPNLRIVKGAYLEPESVAMTNKVDVDAAYRRLVYAHLKAGHPTAIATHDEHIIDDVKRFVLAHGIARSQFEFQMLYGIRRDLQRQLAREGYTVRAYIPYGRDWYAYFSRRIAERPANVMFVLRGMLKG
ncbi:proline dehydrogenase family protein [Deinococcus peraridilitoris]|uniref:proline dehydrogenase n=1 Tax=Deinococcus peraridilitoris (strain DSM 19664 / LMG 22246 / CIP 109416 / KR-200) TaxID=937777 RepID=L0A492_DEIPD|nr:proline dehydrogenase [Deinococcus peraridilitoris]AFZ68249.1 proline dehydrogenase [Deinococcus peraridilitoris DSM 19664]